MGGDEHTTVVDRQTSRWTPGAPRRSHPPATPRPDTTWAAKLILPVLGDPAGRHRFLARLDRNGWLRHGETEPFLRHEHRRSLDADARSCTRAPSRSSCACAAFESTRTPCPFRNSRRSVLCHRSTFPVVVGDRGAVRRWLMPFSRQIRSKSTSPVPGPKRPVNTLPLSDRISLGTPWGRIARRPRRAPDARSPPDDQRRSRTGCDHPARHDEAGHPSTR